MKKSFLLFPLILALVITACDNPTSSSDDKIETDGLWTDSPSVDSNLLLDAQGNSAGIAMGISRATTERATTEEDRIFFRSSDAEFWCIDSLDDIDNIFSAKYQTGYYEQVVDSSLGFADGRSLEYRLGDLDETVVFKPGENQSISLGQGLNDDWATDTAAFISAGNNKINLVRLDVGAGEITFIHDGIETDLNDAYGESFSGLGANSIVFVDSVYLSEVALVKNLWQVANDEVTADELGIEDSTYALVKKIAENHNNMYDSATQNTVLDMSGALFVPLDPVDLTGFDANSQTLEITITWDIADAIGVAEDGLYYMADRVAGTCFDFNVSIEKQ